MIKYRFDCYDHYPHTITTLHIPAGVDNLGFSIAEFISCTLVNNTGDHVSEGSPFSFHLRACTETLKEASARPKKHMGSIGQNHYISISCSRMKYWPEPVGVEHDSTSYQHCVMSKQTGHTKTLCILPARPTAQCRAPNL